jgi:hypothetical protein
LPLIVSGETLAINESCAVVNGVGVALGCTYSEAVKPGKTFVGKGISFPSD